MYRRLFTAILFASTLIAAAVAQDGPKDAVVLIIRHAEDADSGDGISPRGENVPKRTRITSEISLLIPLRANPVSSLPLKTHTRAIVPG